MATKTATRSARPDDTLAPHRESITAWLHEEARFLPRARDVVDQLCQRLVAAGVPLLRVIVSVRTIHPEIVATGYVWKRDAEGMEIARGRDVLSDPGYLQSPFKVIHDGAGGIRRRLDDPSSPNDFPILAELREQGATDYLAVPILFSDGTVNVGSITGDRPGGFKSEELALIYDVLPPFSMILDAITQRQLAVGLLETYIGRHAGERVLHGEIVRGAGETIYAVVAYSDMRGFTRLSQDLPRDEVIALLNAYFERIIEPIHAHGGQVLKLIGDGVLAIYPLGDPAFAPYVCRSAIDAALEAEAGVAELNEERTRDGKPPLRFGYALHKGDVMYGNIGSPNRLDFTVIGPTVNCAQRIEERAAEIGETVVVSRIVANICGRDDLVPLGAHQLRGIDAPQELFAIRREADAAARAAS